MENINHTGRKIYATVANDGRERTPERVALDEAYEAGNMSTSEYDAAVDEIKVENSPYVVRATWLLWGNMLEVVEVQLPNAIEAHEHAADLLRKYGKPDLSRADRQYIVSCDVVLDDPATRDELEAEAAEMDAYEASITEIVRRFADYNPE